MGNALHNGNETQGIEGDKHGFNPNEGGHMIDKSGEGSSSSNVPMGAKRVHGNSQMNIDDAEKSTQAPKSSPQNATPYASSSTNQKRPRFFIERADDFAVVYSLYAKPRRSKICKLAYKAMEELSKIAHAEKPLWQPQMGHKFDTMDNIEYLKHYSQAEETLNMADVGVLPPVHASAQKQTPLRGHVNVEASRDMRNVKMSPLDIVNLLMDVDEWSRAFHSIVARSAFLGTFLSGENGSYDGKLQMMSAEFQFPSPDVATRECYFARYCKKLSDDTWGVVDFSLENVYPCPPNKFRRRPSGCLIQQLPEGFSKVVWVENVEDENRDEKRKFEALFSSGLAFGAARWLSALARHISCVETLTATAKPLSIFNGCLLNLAGRTMRSFCADVSASSLNQWTQVEDLRFMFKNFTKESSGRVSEWVFSTCVSLPNIKPNQLFDFVRDLNLINLWDTSSSLGHEAQELVYLIQGNDPRNRVCLMQAKKEDSSGLCYVLENHTDSTTGASYIVYAPIRRLPLTHILKGGNPEDIPIMSSGFAILPNGELLDDEDGGHQGGCKGSIVTIVFSVFLSITTSPTVVTPKNVAGFKKLFANIVNRFETNIR